MMTNPVQREITTGQQISGLLLTITSTEQIFGSEAHHSQQAMVSGELDSFDARLSGW